ncbi:DNA repair protein RecN [Pseudoruegeria sp. SK021]|uniref:DNA repair protein RecN n=1 Tax=Pseudoruegeria sp. SK021 TaxID=1933035 RepID=UPI000A262E9C|nr:DNA repair protein RecN [Pseudoruegeria sp. SK021]OSP54982.1 DNA repair protein RecN [Pseudoruegeria sp. SK021]
MLRGLEIRDILIIERLDLEFQPGLNVLTGETGTGKSILLDCLGFVLGWRGRTDLVRHGTKQGVVSASFDLSADHAAHAILQEAGLPDGDELVLRRSIAPDGRKTAWVNDRRCTGEVLRGLSDCLVELHGQHDDRGLLDSRQHLALLDSFAAHPDLLDRVRVAWRRVAAARKARTTAAETLEAARQEEEFLRHALVELAALNPQPGEDAVLDKARRRMQAAERLGKDVQQAAEALGPAGVERLFADAARWLEDAARGLEDQLQAPIAALDRAMAELAEAQSGIDACLDAISYDPFELENTEERLFALRALARKHDVLPDDLAALANAFSARIDGIDQGADTLTALDADLAAARADLDAVADALTLSRQQAARRLDAAMMAELAPLKMDRAVFTTVVDPGRDGPDGRDVVAFRVATNPGAPAGALEKIASGGELSRFLLALKVCLTSDSSGVTMIFDEIDRGVGGATADAVGRRLAALANDSGGQVLVVTHSPQVAALGAHHWRVEKRVTDGVTTSTVVPLAPQDRIDEIARMISGDQVSTEARHAARALLSA